MDCGTVLSCVSVQKLSVLIAVFVVFSSGLLIAYQAEASGSSNESVKIMPLGDSITYGYTKFLNGTVDPDPAGYRQELWVDLNNSGYNVDFVGSLSSGDSKSPPYFDTDHEGHGGRTASWINSQLNGYLNTSAPDIVLYHIGTNSLYDDDVIQAALDANESLRIIYAYDPDVTVFLAKIILTTDSAQNNRTRSYNLLLEEHAGYWSDNGYSIVVVDMETALTPAVYPEGDFISDGLHPNANGYAKMADVWYNGLSSFVGPPPIPEFVPIVIIISVLAFLTVVIVISRKKGF